jgi:hypothetical protein
LRRCLGTFARRASRLLDVVAHHRDDRMVRHAALARTVVVENVTKPKLALLHQRSRNIAAGRE